MALDPLATTADLEARGIPTSDTDRVDAALAAASEAVREAAGCPITRTTSTVTVYPGCDATTALPGGPVRSVASVTVRGVAVAAGRWSLVDGHLWAPYTLNAVPPGGVEVTYDHGYDECPADIVELVCNLAGASILSSEPRDPRVASEAIDDSRTAWATGADATVSIMELPERTRQMLRRRFGGGVYVTGS